MNNFLMMRGYGGLKWRRQWRPLNKNAALHITAGSRHLEKMDAVRAQRKLAKR